MPEKLSEQQVGASVQTIASEYCQLLPAGQIIQLLDLDLPALLSQKLSEDPVGVMWTLRQLERSLDVKVDPGASSCATEQIRKQPRKRSVRQAVPPRPQRGDNGVIDRLFTYLKEHPNSRSGLIKQALKISDYQLRAAVQKSNGRLRAKGKTNTRVYYAR